MRQWGRATRAAVTQRARIKCVALDKPSDARLRNQARVAEQDVRKRFIYDLQMYPSRTITGSAWFKDTRVTQNHQASRSVGSVARSVVNRVGRLGRSS